MKLDPEFLKFQESIEREIHQVWMPHGGQFEVVSAFFLDWLTGVFVQCGRKYGKTELAIYILYMFAKLFPNSECYYIADEKDHARDICWDNGRLPRFFTTIRQLPGESHDDFAQRKLKGMDIQNRWIKSINNTEMSVRLDNGSIIKVEGAKNIAKADGLSPTVIVYDEFKSHDRRFDTAMRPNLMALGGRILIIGTPPDSEETYYCQVAKEFQNKKHHKYFKRPCYHNEIVYPGGKDNEHLKEEEKEYRRRKEWHIFAREYLAEIYPDEQSRIFPMFRKQRHVGSYRSMLAEIKRSIKQWDLYISYDPANATVFGVLLIAINRLDKRVWALDEIYEDEQLKTTAKQIYLAAKAKRDEIYEYEADWTQIYDYAAAWFQTEIAVEFDEAIHPCTKDLKNKDNKLSVIKDMLLYDRLMYSERCLKSVWEIENYKKDEKGKIPKENDHNIDNLRYILNQAYYSSVPKTEIKPDDLDNRRYYTPLQDLKKQAYNELLMGGMCDSEFDDLCDDGEY